MIRVLADCDLNLARNFLSSFLIDPSPTVSLNFRRAVCIHSESVLTFVKKIVFEMGINIAARVSISK